MKHRIFIVGPCNEYKDQLYQICLTQNHRNSILDIYQDDEYEEWDSTCRKESALLIAKRLAKKIGFKGRIVVI